MKARLQLVSLKELVLLAMRAIGALQTADQQNSNSDGDDHRQNSTIAHQPMQHKPSFRRLQSVGGIVFPIA
jgi:hypothetical protein